MTISIIVGASLEEPTANIGSNLAVFDVLVLDECMGASLTNISQVVEACSRHDGDWESMT